MQPVEAELDRIESFGVVVFDEHEGEGRDPTEHVLEAFAAKPLPIGLTVLGRNYVVGEISEAGEYSSTLRLVTDPSFRAPARILRLVKPGEQRTFSVSGAGLNAGREPRVFRHNGRTHGEQFVGEAIEVNAAGDGDQVVCRQVPAFHRIRPGDVLTTARLAELPFRLTIGRVVEVTAEAANPHFVTILVEPKADLATLREVYIVLPIGGQRN